MRGGAVAFLGRSDPPPDPRAHREHLAYARAALAGSPLSVLAVEGGWYVPVQTPRVRTEEEWALELLGREGVLVQPGFYDFDTEAFLVLSLLTRPEAFREGLARLRRMAEA